MKIRTGFVSNSSSSSFLVAAKIHSVPKIQIELYSDLDHYAERYIESVEELEDFYKEEYGENWNDDEWVDTEKYNELLSFIKCGYKLLYCTVSSDDYDDPMSLYLYSNGITQDILVDGVIIDED